MTDEELDEALAELEETRVTAEEELATIRGRKKILEKLEQDRDALLESYAQMTPEGARRPHARGAQAGVRDVTIKN
jgi:hypothetical protein